MSNHRNFDWVTRRGPLLHSSPLGASDGKCNSPDSKVIMEVDSAPGLSGIGGLDSSLFKT